MQRLISVTCALILIITVTFGAPYRANATILTFDAGVLYTQYVENGDELVQSHGDRVMGGVQGSHTYRRGLGWTPAIEVSYDDSVEFRVGVFDWGRLEQPVAVTYNSTFGVNLTADAGWEVVLDSIQVGSRSGDRTLPHLIVWDVAGGGESLFLESNGSAPNSHSREVVFSDAVRSRELRIEIATGDPAGWDFVGFDHLSFHQVPAGLFLGDADRDGQVGLNDFALLKTNFGQAFSSASWDRGDFNSDRLVDLDDFALLKEHFGRASLPVMAAVPEPSCLSLGLTGLVLLAAAVRRTR